jgi:hypothetical protein
MKVISTMIKKFFISYCLLTFLVCTLQASGTHGAISYLRAVITAPTSTSEDVADARLQLATLCTQPNDYWSGIPKEIITACYEDVLSAPDISAEIHRICKYRYAVLCSGFETGLFQVAQALNAPEALALFKSIILESPTKDAIYLNSKLYIALLYSGFHTPALRDKKAAIALCQELLKDSLDTATRSLISVVLAETLLDGNFGQFIFTKKQLKLADEHVINLYEQCDDSLEQQFIEAQIKLVQINFWGNKKVRNVEKGIALCQHLINEYASERPGVALIAETLLNDFKQGRKEPTSWEDLTQKAKEHGM